MTQLNSKVNPPVELENDGIVLNQGLDLTSSNLQVDKGALRDCLNFEVVDRLGYQTLSGFDRHDGALSPDQVEFWAFRVNADHPSPSVGSVFVQLLGQRPMGVCVHTQPDVAIPSSTWVVYARFDADAVVQAGVQYREQATGLVLPFTSAITAEPYVNSPIVPAGDTAADIYEDYQTWNAVLRARVSPLPSQPIGVHWYRDRLYAVVDELRLGFVNAGGLISGPPSVTVKIEPNMILRNQGGDFCCRVLDVESSSTNAQWAASSAVGIFLVEPLAFFNGLTTVLNPTPPTSGLFDVLYEVPTSSNWNAGSNEFFTGLFEARPLTDSDPAPSYAGLWRTKDEPNTGWEYIEAGWKLDYENGLSSSDNLRKVERASDNNFVFDTDDVEGLSQSWFNGAVTSPNLPATTQNASGWKDSASPDQNAEDPDNIETEDNTSFLIGDIDFGFLARAGTNVSLTVGQPSRLGSQKNRLADATVPLIDLPTTGTRQAGYSDARAPMTFLNIGNLLGTLPKDAEINGIEVATKVRLGFSGGGTGLFDPVLYPSVFNLQDALVEHFKQMFKVSCHLGKIDSDIGALKLLGQKRSGTCALPAARTSYTWTTRIEPVTNYWDIEVEWDSSTNTTLSIGGANELFGNPTLTIEEASSRDFGIILYGETESGLAPPVFGFPPVELGGESFSLVGGLRLSFDQIVLRVHYTEPSARYYVRETANKVLTFDLVNYSVKEGQLVNGNAKGSLQVTNIRSVNAGADFKSVIRAGDQIFRDPTFSRKVADVSGTAGTVAMELNGFAPLKDIVAQGSRYQFITANFFAREDWDGFYGVSGAGKAFSFAAFDADGDGGEDQYIQFITTNTIEEDEDKPRHIAFHQYHLALGYRDGTVRFSAPGEPENFDGLLGAAEVGVGDRVTGLLAMRGKALGVFCDGSIYTVLGGSADNFNVEVLSPYAGAIEYTVVDNGGQPLYCDYRGISTLEQSQKYGNFVGYRISQRVTPWLLPRMTRSDDLFEINNAAGVVCAVPVRSKNQYRIFFRDGFFLIYTAMPDGSGAFTYGQYYLDDDRSQYFVPIAHSSQVDNDGRERIHMVHYSPKSSIAESESKYVYEFERGLGFDGSWYDAFFETAFSYKDPFKDNTIRKIRADGLTRGYGPYTITVAKDYDEDSYSSTLIPLSLPRSPSETPTTDYKPATTMANVAKEGRCLSFRVERDEDRKTLVPPTVFQVLLAQYQVGGKRDA